MREKFVAAYLGNGYNSAQAAVTAGYKNKNIHRQGYELLKHPEVKAKLEAAAKRVADIAEISNERTLREVKNVAFNDSRKFYRDDGSLVPPSEWDEGMAASVASFEVTEIWGGHGDDREQIGRVCKLKFWPKLEAADKLMKHLGLFERDNRQRQENLAIQVNLVGPDPGPGRDPQITVRANLIDGRRE